MFGSLEPLLFYAEMANAENIWLVTLFVSGYAAYIIMLAISDNNLSNYKWIFTKLGTSKLKRSGLGLLMSKFCQFLTKLSTRHMSDVS